MICNKCKKDGGNGAVCKHCGATLAIGVECPKCGALSTYAFCPHCATQLDYSYADKRLSLVRIYGETLVTCDECITEFVVPNCVTQIDEYAFGNCAWLEKVVIPDSVKSIGNFAFTRCRWLEQVIIASSVTQIGDYLFSKCEKLKDIYFQGSRAQWERVQKGADWSKDLASCTLHCADGDIQL